MIIVRVGQRPRFYRPVDDEAVTWSSTSIQGLTPSKVAAADLVTMRFSAGDGRLRFTGQDASATAGIPVTMGDIETMTSEEAQLLRGIRVGAADLVAWVTYYRASL